MRRYPLSFGCALVLLASVFSHRASAGGFDNSYIGIRGGAMGHALTGLADDASAVYYNPAGLILNNTNKWEGEAYIYFNFVRFEYEDKARLPPTTDTADVFYYVPGFFLSRRFERVALGCGLYVPYGGGGVDYDDFQGSGFRFRYLAGFSAFTPAAAFRVTDRLSVGAGFSLYYGQMESEMFDPAFASVVKSKYDRILAGYGVHVSLLYKPLEALKTACSWAWGWNTGRRRSSLYGQDSSTPRAPQRIQG